jgi:hypothetical protein
MEAGIGIEPASTALQGAVIATHVATSKGVAAA